jgi:hypothetical protein
MKKIMFLKMRLARKRQNTTVGKFLVFAIRLRKDKKIKTQNLVAGFSKSERIH